MRTTKRYFRLALLALCLAALFASVTALAADPYQWPVPSSINVMQRYKGTSHSGIDIGGTTGSKVVATKSGTVTYMYTGCVNKNAAGSGNRDCTAAGCTPNCKTYNKNGKQICNWGYGNGVIIQHADGSGYSMYAHMDSVSVRKGDTVSQGAQIGMLGSSGYSTGPHLHFELTKTVQQSGTYFKPTSSINSNTSSIAYVDGPTSSSGSTTPAAAVTFSAPTELYRYAQSKGQGFTGAWAFQLDYSDVDAVSDYAYDAMCWTTMHSIINGMGDGTLAPQGQATRAQVATMLMRFIENVA